MVPGLSTLNRSWSRTLFDRRVEIMDTSVEIGRLCDHAGERRGPGLDQTVVWMSSTGRATAGMVDQLSGATRLSPIIGDPIEYVESPQRLTRSFAARGHNGVCVPMQVTAADLDAVSEGLTRSRNVDGILVTMPHKRTAFAHCATHSDRGQDARGRERDPP